MTHFEKEVLIQLTQGGFNTVGTFRKGGVDFGFGFDSDFGFGFDSDFGFGFGFDSDIGFGFDSDFGFGFETVGVGLGGAGRGQ